MAKKTSNWTIVEGTLLPLKTALSDLVKRMRRPYNPATTDDKSRLPPTSVEFDIVYRKYSLSRAIEWLRFHKSVDYGDRIQKALFHPFKRLQDLEFEANQRLRNPKGKSETLFHRYGLHMLINQHYKEVRLKYPDKDDLTHDDELPEFMATFNREIFDEYALVERGFGSALALLEELVCLLSNDAPNTDVESYVTLLQMAAIVNKTKKCIQNLKYRGKLPPACIQSGPGQAHEWKWSVVKPILEDHFCRVLPETFPSDRFVK